MTPTPRMGILWLVAWAAATLAVLGHTPPARAQDPAPAVIIFDGSGSMWGELSGDKSQKLETTRQALRTKLQAMPASARVGLLSFGHRRKGNCTDVEVIAAPEAGPPERLTNPLDKLDPKGKGPVAASLREAHKLLSGATTATIILVHDGPDNCGQDPCEAAASIAAASPGLTIHTIGLDLERPEAQRLQCISKATNGRAFDVRDGASATAAINDVIRLANLDTGGSPGLTSPSAITASPDTPAESVKADKPGLHLSASLTENGPVLTAPVRWRIFKDGDDGAPILERLSPAISEQIAPGKYTVEAQFGLATARGPVEVADNAGTTLTVPLRAGILNLAMPSQSSHAPLPEALLTVSQKIELPADAKGAVPGFNPVWLGRGNDHNIVLPEGSYTVRLQSGLAAPQQDIAIKAGETLKVAFDLSFGRLDLAASMSEGGPPASDVTFIISEDDPESPQGRREVARSAHPEPSFALPSGTYYVTAKTASNEVRQRIALGKGDALKRVIVVGLTRLEVSAALEQGSLPPNTGVLHRVLTLDTEPKEVARERGPSAAFLLANGRYRIETQLGTENVRSSTDVDVQPGRDAKIVAKLQAARLSIKSDAGSAGARSEANNWEIRDSQGSVVWRLKNAEGRTALLAPGRYVLRSGSGAARSEKPFELKAGESRILDLLAP